jgi:hypothetical protein
MGTKNEERRTNEQRYGPATQVADLSGDIGNTYSNTDDDA